MYPLCSCLSLLIRSDITLPSDSDVSFTLHYYLCSLYIVVYLLFANHCRTVIYFHGFHAKNGIQLTHRSAMISQRRNTVLYVISECRNIIVAQSFNRTKLILSVRSCLSFGHNTPIVSE